VYEDIEGFNWDHTDEFRNEWSWPEDDPSSTDSHFIHSDHWALGFMGNVFAERLKEVLTNCQPYPGDEQALFQSAHTLCLHVSLSLVTKETYLLSVIINETSIHIFTCREYA
jgi:hypothetical protein